jgi:hypothetical protein
MCHTEQKLCVDDPPVLYLQHAQVIVKGVADQHGVGATELQER